ncbi:MAG TPA: matrixin family metalloprotease, partial [bacterium]|nr:matrixin family metalloprotease [bacterium]
MKRIGLFFVLISLFSFSYSYADSPYVVWDMFEAFESKLLRSDIIIVGEVKDSFTKRIVDNGEEKLVRYSTVVIEEVIYSTIPQMEKEIVVETLESYYSNGSMEPLIYIPPHFTIGKRILALMVKEGGKYKLLQDVYGKFDIINNTVAHCGAPLDVFINEIREVTQSKSDKFKVKYPSFYIQYRPTGVAKVAAVHEDLHSLEFRASEGYCYDDNPHQIQFKINPTDANDGNGNPIGFAKLHQYVTSACSMWSAIDDTDINFTVHADSFTIKVENWGNGESVISFKSMGPDARAEFAKSNPDQSDITLNKNINWSLDLDDQSSQTQLYKTIAHEMGHSVGIGDMGRECTDGHNDPASYSDNLMWHSGTDMDWNLNTVQNGDKAGAVHQIPNPSGSLQFDEIWSGFKGSSKALEITSNVTVPSGKTLEIESDDQVEFDSGVTLEVS